MEPDWLGPAVSATRDEVRLFLRTWAAFALHPHRSASAWARGELRALNPIAFLLNAVAVLGTYRFAAARLIGFSSGSWPIWVELVRPMLPAAMIVVEALIAHAILRLCGSRRRASTTVAVYIYASHGLPVLFNVAQWPVILWSLRVRGDGQLHLALAAATALLGLGALASLITVITQALAGAHGVRRPFAFLAMAVSLAAVPALAMAAVGGSRAMMSLLS